MRILHFFITLLLAATLTAQTEKRYALVIGNGDYAVAPLGPAPLNDARAMRDTLTRAGFEVSWRENRKLGEMNADIAEFARKIEGSGAVALFFYSGHGLQFEGRNFLVPIGADLADEYDIDAKCVPAERLTAWMQSAGTPVNIVILNACRAYPVKRRTMDLRAGLAEMPRIPEMLIAYAAAPGAVADTRGEAGMSLYTFYLLKNMVVHGQTLEDVFKSTRRDVIARSGGTQRPEETSNLTYDFYFFPAATVPVTPPPVVSEKPADPRPGPTDGACPTRQHALLLVPRDGVRARHAKPARRPLPHGQPRRGQESPQP